MFVVFEGVVKGRCEVVVVVALENVVRMMGGCVRLVMVVGKGMRFMTSVSDDRSVRAQSHVQSPALSHPPSSLRFPWVLSLNVATNQLWQCHLTSPLKTVVVFGHRVKSFDADR